MIDIEINGGLGNQMFQYALAVKLMEQNKKVRIDTSFYQQSDKERELLLHIFEGVDYSNLCWSNETSKVQKFIYSIKKRKEYKDRIFIYQPEVFQYKDVILQGYWQNEKYFSDIDSIIRKTFSFRKELISNNNHKLADELSKCNSVSVHIRRGDYMSPKFSSVYADLCCISYYPKAIEYIISAVDNACLYIFSDDIDWVRENIQNLIPDSVLIDKIRFVDINTSDSSYMDMYLMSSCKHHIIANSTFSWWGAWLGNNKDKIVIAPSRWFCNNDKLDIICDSWTKV